MLRSASCEFSLKVNDMIGLSSCKLRQQQQQHNATRERERERERESSLKISQNPESNKYQSSCSMHFLITSSFRPFSLYNARVYFEFVKSFYSCIVSVVVPIVLSYGIVEFNVPLNTV